MAEPTETDWEKAYDLIRENTFGWPESEGVEELTDDQERHVEAIASALAAAREQGKADAYSLISQAVHARGVLDCTDFERGPVVRKVLGKLPVTADGCVVSAHQWVFVPGHAGKFGLSPNLTVPYAVRDDKGQWRDLRVDECYSTRAAAESARPTP